jgi:hypothetical protein
VGTLALLAIKIPRQDWYMSADIMIMALTHAQDSAAKKYMLAYASKTCTTAWCGGMMKATMRTKTAVNNSDFVDTHKLLALELPDLDGSAALSIPPMPGFSSQSPPVDLPLSRIGQQVSEISTSISA